MKKTRLLLCFIAISIYGIMHIDAASYQPQTSVGGLFNLNGSGREFYDFNVGWRFMKGDFPEAKSINFDDSGWEIIATPHTVQLMPAEGSGSRNYQGPVWYRKKFIVDKKLVGKKLNVYFEAAMGRSTVYLNGQEILTHLGGYLPFSINLSEYAVKAGDECLIAVRTDNSDDRDFPPGKKQATLDFTYHGGIYRDVWLIATSSIYITDPNKANIEAGGGIFVQYGDINKNKAESIISADIKNDSKKAETVIVEQIIADNAGKVVGKSSEKIQIKAGETKRSTQKITLKNPSLWHPDHPHLYKLQTRIMKNGKSIDGGITRIGFRTIEFKGKEGLYINGEYAERLIGGNRHQDYAYVGNAVPNSQHWLDAKKLREAGYRIVRVAHYPQDPSFMDACDELGIFVIVATPGWQYWNKDPKFAELVYQDIRNMIRRDRNHPSVIMWEPILNETRFPLDFALKAQQIVRTEQPRAASAADAHSAGIAENYEVVYGWPKDVGQYNQCIFTREFGENVDDWYAHNTNNRASRSWGETPQLVQAKQLAIAYNEMFPEDKQFIGGAQWHPFDHQRGYHPDPYWGGTMDAFRQPKYSYYMFKSQVDPNLNIPNVEAGPMVFIAHEISPFSSPDVTVLTNCDEVRLIVYETDTLIQKVVRQTPGMPHPPVIFNDVYDFNKMRVYPYAEKNWQKVSFVAEGLIDGKVVCSTKKMPARRSTKLRLSIDNANQQLIANGSDFIPIICEVTDDQGNVRRLAKENILFTIEGEGNIIGDASIGANPRAVEFGSAPVLVRSTLNRGKIKVKARVLFEGEHAPAPDEIEFESIAPGFALMYSEKPQAGQQSAARTEEYTRKLSEDEKQKILNEVELQQTEFGEKKGN